MNEPIGDPPVQPENKKTWRTICNTVTAIIFCIHLVCTLKDTFNSDIGLIHLAIVRTLGCMVFLLIPCIACNLSKRPSSFLKWAYIILTGFYFTIEIVGNVIVNHNPS